MKIKTRRKIIDLTNHTAIMGIVNMTPDSFSDGGEIVSVEAAVEKARQMLEEGAEIIDIGGESTRPDAEPVTEAEELRRVVPVIEALRKALGNDFLISIDTYKANVAKKAVEWGADIINDVSGLTMDEKMLETAAKLGVPLVINHMRGVPKTMQKNVSYKDVVGSVKDFFFDKIKLLKSLGFDESRVILDPGFGFGKTVENNIEIIRRLDEFKSFEKPLMIGISRKSTIGKILQEKLGKEIPAKDRFEGTLAATAVAVLKGANIVRTHDVDKTRKFLAVLDTIKSSK